MVAQLDDADRASEREEIFRAESLTKRMPVLKPCGFCHWCSSGVGASENFCPGGCMDDYQKQFDSDRRNGR